MFKRIGIVFCAATLQFGIGSAAQAQPAKPQQIVVNDSGGATQAANRKTFYTEFEKRYGIKIVNTSPVDLGKLQDEMR